MPRTPIKLNSAGIAELLNGEAAERACRPLAEKALAAAQAGAPVKSGDYRASLHIEEATTDRKVFRVVADVPHAAAVEADTGNLARSL